MSVLPEKAIVGCVHLLPTPGTPMYRGDARAIHDTALADAQVMLAHGVDALVVENFRDGPFLPGPVSPATIAALATVTGELVRHAPVPVGVAALRNDATGALSVAAATGAAFIRVNVHIGAVLSAQGVLEGTSHATLRLRRELGCDVEIFADAAVKHSRPLAYPDLAEEVRDLSASADGIIVSGALTGTETDLDDLVVARRATTKPVLVGSGVTRTNLRHVYHHADGFVVGSDLKVDGVAANPVDAERVAAFMAAAHELRLAAAATA